MSTATAVPATHELEGDDALETLRRTGWGRLARDAFQRFRAADGFSHARALGFQITLTALPALIAIVGLATLLHQKTFRHVFERTVTGLAPGPAGRIVTQAVRQGSSAAGGSGRIALLVGTIAAVVAGTTAMGQIERGANRIYGIEKDRPTMSKYGRGFVLALSAGVLGLAAFVLLVAGRSIADAGRSAGGWSNGLVTIWQIGRWPIGVALVIGAIALLFRRSPNRPQPAPSWLASGAAISVGLWVVFTALLSLYVGASKSFGQTYGPLAGVIGVLLWALLTSVALFLGLAVAAQLEAVRAGVHAPTTDRESDGGAMGHG
jgi:YihY family inner membrane protein